MTSQSLSGFAQEAQPWGASATQPSGRAAPGSLIAGRYTLRAAIGTGGMGTVWRASDTLLRREVAVKEVVCPPGLAPSDRDAMYERTMREARAAAALSHPSVVQVYDVVTEDGRPWIVMELLDARSLADLVLENGPLAPRAVAKIGIALLGALEVAHAAGVLHRDVKPANVLICADGRCVLTDFGVARMPTDVQLTTPGMVLGSPHFISPERAMGGPFGPPSDLFSLGVSLYTAVEGRPPFDRGDPIETMHAVVEDPPAAPTRAGPLAGVLFGLLEKDPSRRWDVPSARSVLRDLVAGPLANRARDHITDPYAVVPVQRPASPPQIVPSGQIGGRAMVGDGESLDDAIARSRGGGPAPAAGWAEGEATGGWAPADGGTGAWAPAGNAWVPAPADQSQWPVSPAGSRPGSSAGRRRAGRGRAGRGRRRARPMTLALAAGAVTVVLMSTFAIANGWFGGAQPSSGGGTAPPTGAPASADRPLIDAQPHTQDRITLNVPATWKKSTGGSYVDFTDPADGGRRIRINIEPAGNTARRFLEVAENRLQGNANNNCAGYQRVELRETTLGGQPAAELEYTCTQAADQVRHGIWRATVQGGKAYHFYLTTPEPRFAESKVIFEELVRSFALAA